MIRQSELEIILIIDPWLMTYSVLGEGGRKQDSLVVLTLLYSALLIAHLTMNNISPKASFVEVVFLHTDYKCLHT